MVQTVTVPARESAQPLPRLLDVSVGVIDGGSGVGDALVSALVASGVDAHSAEDGATSTDGGLIVLSGLRDVEGFEQATAIDREVFTIAQQFAHRADGGMFVTVSGLGGHFGSRGTEGAHAWAAGITGLTRTAAIEWPGTAVKAIDIECVSRTSDEVAAAIAHELLTGGEEPEVGVPLDGTRSVLQSVASDLEPGDMPIGADDVVVVSGGGRGVTAATTIALAQSSKATFVLLGRSRLHEEQAAHLRATDDAGLKRVVLDDAAAAGRDLSPSELSRIVSGILAGREIRETIAGIERAGGRARYIAVDITDAEAVGSACAHVRREVGPITGLVHGAGVLADKLIADKTIDQFDMVFDTKVVGARNLLDATAGDDLRLLCLFSSIAAREGNTGQVDYAMANEVLNRVAVDEGLRRGPSCVVKALGWGPWAGGMVTPSLQSHFETLGVPLIGLDAGAKMFVDEVSAARNGQVEVLLGGGLRAQADGAPPAVAVHA